MQTDFERRAGSIVRTEGEIRGIELAKDVGGFVGFAGVGVEHVLEQRIEGAGNRGISNHAFKIAFRGGRCEGGAVPTRSNRRSQPCGIV